MGSEPTAVAAGNSTVWVANRADGTVSRVDASSGRVTAVVRVGRGPSALAVDGASLWVANQDAGAVSRVDTRDNQIVQTLHVGDAPAAIAVAPNGVWDADSVDSTVSRIDRARGIVPRRTPCAAPRRAWRWPAARYVVSVLRRLGFRATLQLLAPTRFLDYTADSRNRAQVISGVWGAAWPSASNFIARLGCRFFVPGSATSANGSEFCDPDIDRLTDRAMALAPRNPVAGHALWARLDRELTDRAIWLPLATPKNTDFVSGRIHNYALHPIWGPLIDQLWLR